MRDFIHHIVTCYADFDEATRATVTASMEMPWTGGPFEIVISQIENGAAAYLAAGTVMDEQTKCDKLYAIVRNSGLLSSACQKWRMENPLNKSWINCTEHFLKYANDRDNDSTASSTGYTASVNVTLPHHNNAHVAAIENATTALNVSIERMALMAKMQQDSNKTIFKLQADLAAAQAQVTVLQTMAGVPAVAKKQPTHYCWTHGPNLSHSGSDCQKPSVGHRAEATFNNKLGGKTTRGQRA